MLKTFQAFKRPAVISMLFVMFLSAQTSIASAEESLTVSISGDKGFVHVSGNTWMYFSCSDQPWKGKIQQKVKGKWTSLKKVTKSNENLMNRNCANDPKYPVPTSWSFTEKKIGKKQYRLSAYGKSYKFTVVVAAAVAPAAPAAPATKPAAPAPKPAAPAPIRRPASSQIASLSSGLDSAVANALGNSLASGDIACATRMQDLSRFNFSGYQEDYRNGYISEIDAIRKLEAGWTLVTPCS